MRQIDTSQISLFSRVLFQLSNPPDPNRHSASTHTHRWLSSSFGWLYNCLNYCKAFKKILEFFKKSPFASKPRKNLKEHSKKHILEQLITLPETNSSHLKLDGWKTNFLLGHLIFTGYVSFREGNLFCHPLVPVVRSPAQRPFLRQRYPEILATIAG